MSDAVLTCGDGQGDILSLMRCPLVAGGCGDFGDAGEGEERGASLLAVTVSQRGSATLYRHDLVDALVLLTRHLAHSHGLRLQVCGVCSYKISAPMYTVAFEVCREVGRGDGREPQDTPAAQHIRLCRPPMPMPRPGGGKRQQLEHMAGDWLLFRGTLPGCKLLK